ncbi:MAG: hypothetical protein K6B14_06265 [Lachnospiraceae bacterium]|nr:hypothetical protein [Lachnospiraceae bacterium]
MGGMTDGQFKAYLRDQKALQEDILEKLKENKIEEAERMLERLINRIQENINDI